MPECVERRSGGDKPSLLSLLSVLEIAFHLSINPHLAPVMADDGGSSGESGGSGTDAASVSTVSVTATASQSSPVAAHPPASADSGNEDDDGRDTVPLLSNRRRGRGWRRAALPTLSNAPLPHLLDEEEDMITVHRARLRRLRNRAGGFSLLPPRPLLLGLSLSLALFTFWLLDSVKDPVFAVLVGGELSHHQPRAKLASVFGTLVVVVLMELVDHRRSRARAAAAAAGQMTEDEIMDGGGSWTQMKVGDSVSHDPHGLGGGGGNAVDDYDDGTRIPSSIFRAVGAVYLFAFAVTSVALAWYTEPGGGVGSSSADGGGDAAIRTEWRALGYLLYFLIESYGSITVACFWAYVNSTLTVTAAERYYGSIVALAQLGAIGGSTVATARTRVSGGVSDVGPLFGVACVGVLLQVAVTEAYTVMFPHPMTPEDDEAMATEEDDPDAAVSFDLMATSAPGSEWPPTDSSAFGYGPRPDAGIDSLDHLKSHDNSLWSVLLRWLGRRPALSGLRLILKHKYVLLILGVSCLYEISLTCLDYEMKLIGLDRFSEESTTTATGGSPGFQSYVANTFAQFMGRYGQLTNVMSLLLSYAAFPYLMRTRGLRSTLRIFPTLLVFVTVLSFVALPMNLPVLFVSVSLLKAMTYSVNDPAKEILYIPTSDAIKFRAKFWIDIVGARIAKAVGSSINKYAGSVDRIARFGTVPSVCTALGLWLACYKVGIEFDSLLTRGEVVGADDDAGGDISSDAYSVVAEEIENHEIFGSERVLKLDSYDLSVRTSLNGREDHEGGDGKNSIELVASLS